MFCENCNNLLERGRENNKTVFRCNYCNLSFDIKPEFTLVFQESTLKDDSFFSHKLKFAGQDPVCKKVALNCTDCKSSYARQVRMKNGQLFNVCTAEDCGKVTLFEEKE